MDFKEPYSSLVTSSQSFMAGQHFPAPERIKIYDVTLRDGEQMPGVAFSPRDKFEIIRAMSDIGVHIIEMGFVSVGGSEREALQLAIQAKQRGELRPDLELLVIARCNRSDILATARALEEVGIAPADVSLATFTSASDLHVKYKIGRVLLRAQGRDEDEQLQTPVAFFRQANIDLLVDAVQYARGLGFQTVQVVAEDVTRADPDYAVELFRAGLAAGGTRPGFCDTVGCATPAQIAFYARRLVEGLPDSGVYTHFHNDYGLGTINTLAALAEGIEIFSASINGLGERAGNANLIEVLVCLRYLYGIEVPGFQYDQVRKLSALVERLSGVPVAPNSPVVGANVFTHESGIHTAGVLIDPRIYESIPAAEVGGATGYIYGKHSGANVIEYALGRHREELRGRGVEITPELVAKVTNQVKTVREEMAAAGHAPRIVAEVKEAVEHLGLTERDVVEIALALAS